MYRKAILVEPKKPLEFVEEPIPETPDDGVVLELLYSGVCHSDVHIQADCMDFGGGVYASLFAINKDLFIGRNLGHEIYGRIMSMGPNASKNFKVGDEVVAYPWAGCRSCEFCKIDRSNFCSDNQFGLKDLGLGRKGGFATHMALPECEKYLIKRGNIDPKVAPLLSCSALTAFSGLRQIKESLDTRARAGLTQNILLIGAGGLGQWAVAYSKHLYPECNLTVADISTEKLEQLSERGVDNTVLFSKTSTIAEKAQQFPHKMDGIIDFVGSSQTASLAAKLLSRGGTMVVIGLIGGQIEASLLGLIDGTQTIKGVRTGSFELMKEMIRLTEEKNIRGPEIFTYKFDQVNEALDAIRNGTMMGRAVLDIKA
ncbi:DgyrCDS1384 [Dimorphilus gyrociliatus]|uniref:DgyrCDS1384 n=1 Tax=Dimorphilus gyrociliatus TaxID=2664684 RepID=A0A7I8V8Z2_9ANNE|nr:DgyrCDS1384 [Dimorphilus gyrociliatus]